MPKTFDATLKDLIRKYPRDWLARLGIPAAGEPEVLDADLSAVTAAADTLIKTDGGVVHIDIESRPDDSLARRMLLYNVLAHHHTGLPVHSVVVLLRPDAAASAVSGMVEYAAKPAHGELRFRFEVMRVWETPTETFLTGGLGFLPLAVLGKPPDGQTRRQALPDIVGRMAERTAADPAADGPGLLTSAFLLSGMYFDKADARSIFHKVLSMHESSTYVAILEEGAAKQSHKLLLKQGQKRFGEPTVAQAERLKGIEDLDRLERLAVRLLEVGSWDDLLAGK
jgi:hypothetical protein